DAVLFDKTGTLTAGRPEVVSIEWPSGVAESNRDTVQALAASMAAHSRHPLSHGISRLNPQRLPLSDWQELQGRGLEARTQTGETPSEMLRLGSLRWLADSGVDLGETRERVEQWTKSGHSILGFAR